MVGTDCSDARPVQTISELLLRGEGLLIEVVGEASWWAVDVAAAGGPLEDVFQAVARIRSALRARWVRREFRGDDDGGFGRWPGEPLDDNRVEAEFSLCPRHVEQVGRAVCLAFMLRALFGSDDEVAVEHLYDAAVLTGRKPWVVATQLALLRGSQVEILTGREFHRAIDRLRHHAKEGRSAFDLYGIDTPSPWLDDDENHIAPDCPMWPMNDLVGHVLFDDSSAAHRELWRVLRRDDRQRMRSLFCAIVGEPEPNTTTGDGTPF